MVVVEQYWCHRQTALVVERLVLPVVVASLVVGKWLLVAVVAVEIVLELELEKAEENRE